MLFCTAKILHIKQKPLLLILSSALGGAYAVAALFMESTALSVICNILCALLMCFIAYFKVSKYVKLDIKLLRDYISYVLLVIEAIIMIKGEILIPVYIVAGVIFCIIILMYIREIVKMISKLLKAVKD